MMSAIKYTGYFTLLFAGTAFVCHYDIWLTLPPVSIHQWRQADGAAIAWHYAQNPDFFEVSVFNLFKTGDAHAMGELPILYWFSGLMTRYLEWPDHPLRWIGLCWMIAGFWSFGWMILRLTQCPGIAALATSLLLTSPMLAYYGPNFLPDMPAFSMVLLMGACLMRADQQQSAGWLWTAASFAALAIMLKLSMAILPLALLVVWASGKYRERWLFHSIWRRKWPVVVSLVVLALVAGCRCWIAAYNTQHHATYFFAGIRPIWWYDRSAIEAVLKGIVWFGLPAYGSAGLYIACLASSWLWWQHRDSVAFFWQESLLYVVLGCIAFILLWFRMLQEHDYYAICLMVLPAMLLAVGARLSILQYGAKSVLYVLVICWITGLWHCQYILHKRLQLAYHPPNTLNLPPEAFLPVDRLANAGIPSDARVFCPEDPSPNIALTALQRHGWTSYHTGGQVTPEILREYHQKYDLHYLALRDTMGYNGLYRQLFPKRVFESNGWTVFWTGAK